MTTEKTIPLTRWNFVDKVMSLLFNMLSRLVIAFLSRNKRLLVSWLQSPAAVILEPPKIKSLTVCLPMPRNKSNQRGKRFILCKLMRETEEDTSEWKGILWPWIGRINVVKMGLPW